MVRLERKGVHRVQLLDNLPIESPQETLQDALNQFNGSVYNAATIAAIQNVLDRWNYIHQDNVTFNDITMN